VKQRETLAVASVVVVALGVAACGSSDKKSSGSSGSGDGSGASVTVNGAGSTFAAPIYQELGSRLKSQGVTLNYQSVGSGAGVSQFTAGTVDFAGTDPALKDEEVSAVKKSPPQHVPLAFGAITVSYNLSGIKSGLKLDGKTVADIYLGKVKKWNDPEITGQNPGKSLPSTNITVVHRSDSSGTTKGFTSFLSDYSSTWKSKVGADKDVKWPTGTGGKGNEGVAAAVKQTAGAIGYVEQAYALQNGFTFADVKNKSGKYVTPTLEAVSASGEGITIPTDLRIDIINSPNPSAYPISSQTFAVVHQDLCKGGMSQSKAKGMRKALDFALGEGQSVIKQLSYAPLPSGLKAKASAAVANLKCNGSAVSAT
jgi:phosphate transport system substrate-binding protein